jgi:hypothetical protein
MKDKVLESKMYNTKNSIIIIRYCPERRKKYVSSGCDGGDCHLGCDAMQKYTDILEECTASIFRVKEYAKQAAREC